MAITDILGDCAGFYRGQEDRLRGLGIEVLGLPLSHLAFRVESTAAYRATRDALEKFCKANVENVWNGRPISKLLLQEPLDLGAGASVSLIELIPPVHRGPVRMGLEHTGIVLGDAVDEFATRHKDVLTGQQFQSAVCEPYLVTFDDRTTVKFYRYSLLDVCIKEGQSFDAFYHAD